MRPAPRAASPGRGASGLLLVGSTLGLLWACAGRSEAVPWTPWSATRRPVRPSLEEIFLQPSIAGEAPTIRSLSPDGRFLLLRWSEDPDPEERAVLRLLDTRDPAKSDHRGRPLADLLPPRPASETTSSEAEPASQEGSAEGDDGEVPELGPVVWDHRGARLAVARGAQVFLMDPAEPRVVCFLDPPVAPEDEDDPDEGKGEGEDTGDGGDPVPGERRLAEEVRSLAFALDGRSLRLVDAEEMYSLPLPESGLPDAPATLAEAEHHTAEVDPFPLRLQWSVDLAVAFGRDPTPTGDPEEGETDDTETEETDEEGSTESEEPNPRPQVLHVALGRGVALHGMAEMEWIENTSLSPDGRFVFGVEYDRSGQPDETLVPDFLGARVTTRSGRRRLAEDGPSPFRLWTWKTGNGERAAVLSDRVVLSDAEPEGAGAPAVPGTPAAAGRDLVTEGAYWLRTVGWAPAPEPGSPARFAFELYSSDFRDLELWCWTEGFCERLWRERDEAWIGGPSRTTRWTADGAHLVLGSESCANSTTPGRAQLFAIDPDTREIRQLTEVAGEVSSFRTVKAGGVLFEASRGDPARREIGLVPEAQVAGLFPARPRFFPAPDGWNSGVAGSFDGRRVVFRHERLFQPPELWTSDLAASHDLTRTVPDAFRSVEWIRPERIELPSPDGRDVHAQVFLPPGATLNPGGRVRPRATIVFVHGAGYLQNVTDSMTRYPLNLMFHSRLAQLGYPVVDVDYRGSAGYGRDFRTDVQYHLGGRDLEDIHLVVDELVDRGLTDPDRVGIYGGSYGGFMTLMALFTAPDRWAAGAALRSVTDWRTYHPWYTQPRLGRPSTHAEAYERSSPIDHVDGLRHPLLVLHGMMDSNVFAQDSIRLIEALIDGGHDFEAMLYPSQGHAFSDGPHWLDEYRRIERFLLYHLGPPLERRAS